MKNLKIKFGLFSLLAVLAVSVFLTSCEQENLTENTDLITELEDQQFFELPDEFDGFSSEELKIYLESLSEIELQSLLSPTTINTIEERSACSNWVTISVTEADCGHCFEICRRRWCGPPAYGAYEVHCYILRA